MNNPRRTERHWNHRQSSRWNKNHRIRTQQAPSHSVPPSGTLITPDGASVYYETTGSGTPLVLLHGNGQKHQVFAQQTEYFQNRCRLILIDTRGRSSSSLGPYTLTPQLLAKDALMVLDHLGISKALFLGFGDGGNTVLELALHAPQRVLGIMITSASLPSETLKPLFRTLNQAEDKIYDFLEKIHLPVKRRKQAASETAGPVWELSAEELAMIHTPTLVIAGDSDLMRKKYTQSIADAIPDAQLTVVNHAGHLGLFTHAAEYNFIIDSFLTKHRF